MSSITNEANNILSAIKQTGGRRRKTSKKSKKSKKSMKGGKRKSKTQNGKSRSKKSKKSQKGGGCEDNECPLEPGEVILVPDKSLFVQEQREYREANCRQVEIRKDGKRYFKYTKPACDSQGDSQRDAEALHRTTRREIDDRRERMKQREEERRNFEAEMNEKDISRFRARGGRRRNEDDYPRRSSRYDDYPRGGRDYDNYRGGDSETAPVEIIPVTQLGGKRRSKKSKKSKKSMKGGDASVAQVVVKQLGGKRRSKKSKKSMKGGDASTVVAPAQVGGKRRSKKSKKSKTSKSSKK